MFKTRRIIKIVIYINSNIRLQTSNLKNIYELTSKMYKYKYLEFNASIPVFINLIVKIIYLDLV